MVGGSSLPLRGCAPCLLVDSDGVGGHVWALEDGDHYDDLLVGSGVMFVTTDKLLRMFVVFSTLR